MNDETQTDYPHYGTCDSCAEGPKSLREVDPVTEAWICVTCSDRIERATDAAAAAMKAAFALNVIAPDWKNIALTGIAAYWEVLDMGEEP